MRNRAGMVVALTLAGSLALPLAQPAHATGYCGSGQSLSNGFGSGRVDSANWEDWWTTSIPSGTSVITVESPTSLDYLEVHDSSCGEICRSQVVEVGCTVSTSTSEVINVAVYWGGSVEAASDFQLIVKPLTTVGSLGGCTTVASVTACAELTPGSELASFPVSTPGSTPAHVAGYVDAYQFVLPNSGVVTVPCVTLVAATTVNPCQSLGGTFASRLLTLVDTSVNVPGTSGSTTVATVRICEANLVLTVNSLGVNSFPAYTVC